MNTITLKEVWEYSTMTMLRKLIRALLVMIIYLLVGVVAAALNFVQSTLWVFYSTLSYVHTYLVGLKADYQAVMNRY